MVSMERLVFQMQVFRLCVKIESIYYIFVS